MNVIISLVGFEVVRPPQTTYQPHALLHLAGSTVLGHILQQLEDVLTDRVWIIVAEEDRDLVAAWLKEMVPTLDAQLLVAQDGDNPLMTLAQYNGLLDNAAVMFVCGKFIAKFDAQKLVNSLATAVHIVHHDIDNVAGDLIAVDEADLLNAESHLAKMVPSAGISWFKHGHDLRRILATAVAPEATLLTYLQKQPFPVKIITADMCVETSTPPSRLHANARLLQMGYGSQDAIERSYIDEFTVLPPVFIHETAVVNNAIIGPFVNIERNAVVDGSIIRNSFIEPTAEINNVILADSFVGAGVKVNGRSQKLNLPDDPTSAVS